MVDTIGTPRLVEFVPSKWLELSAWHIQLGNPPMVVFSHPINRN
jgi:hypothetical protein